MLMSLFQSFPKLKKTNKELAIKFIKRDKAESCCNASRTVFLITSNFTSLFSASLGSYVPAYTSQLCISNFSTRFMLHEISLCKSSVSTADQEHAHAHTHTHTQVLGHCIYSFSEHRAIKSVLQHRHGPGTRTVFSKI